MARAGLLSTYLALLVALLAMTIKAAKFTPEVLLSAPRRSAGVPNADGSKVLYTVSTYSFADHASTAEVRVLDVASGESTVVSDNGDASEPTWLDGSDILLLLPGSNGTTDVLVGPYDDFANSNYTAGNIDGSASSVKVASLGDGKFAFAITALAKPDGSIYNAEKAASVPSTGRYYEATFVRHWDTYLTPNRNAVWYGTLAKDGEEYSLSSLVNALKGTKLESPVPPFGGTDNFDVSSSGLAFVAKDPELLPSVWTKINVYYVPLSTFTESTAPAPVQVETAGFQGQSTSPVFSPDGKSLAFLRMREIQYESDKLQLFVVSDVSSAVAVNALPAAGNLGSWDRSPSAVTWSADGKTLYLTAENIGRVSLYSLPTPSGNATSSKEPTLIFNDGAVSDAHALETGDVFISGTNLIDNSVYFLLTPGEEPVQISSNSKNGALFGLSRSQVSEIWYPGAANGTKIHAWVIVPSNFTANSTWPLAYLIHGGPQGAWEDSWSTRWNPLVWAEQGYVVVTPNPTGSTGYGKALTDAIQGEWGGLPYEDIVNGFTYIENNLKYVDTDRAVELGASYGGYMTNWIQGHDLGRKFKALVTHDGVFSMTAQLASEEQWFPEHDLEGKYWENRESWLEWDPSAHVDKWATPHLIIHNELDYRLTIAEGLAAFNVLQGRGVESAFLSFPDENHWVIKPENSLLWHTAVFDWINSRVGLPTLSEQSENARAAKAGAWGNRESDLGLKA
ncbi:putative oligopeptidase family protein [Diplodia seriata]|uniref:Dipeptidyl-peptidase V n=1 Tax=Diplodia seriata TaxID=420778 RepID=A0A0G2EZG8_9PEZI|nr:putative oligopeptidase family protein [Diplodia seriata]OMP87622.1 Dipeptidyl-peptidase 5 [Diplodia seriata]